MHGSSKPWAPSHGSPVADPCLAIARLPLALLGRGGVRLEPSDRLPHGAELVALVRLEPVASCPTAGSTPKFPACRPSFQNGAKASAEGHFFSTTPGQISRTPGQISTPKPESSMIPATCTHGLASGGVNREGEGWCVGCYAPVWVEGVEANVGARQGDGRRSIGATTPPAPDHQASRGTTMPRPATGTLLTKGDGYIARVTLADGKRKGFAMPQGTTEREAKERLALMVDLLSMLRASGRLDFMAERFCEKAATIDRGRWRELRDVCARYADGTARVIGDKQLEPTMTFAEFAALWLDGSLARRYPDHVREKRSASDDASRFKRILPIVGHVPLCDFRLEHAEAAMASLPTELSSASRRQYAQLIARTLTLAAYPAKVIDRSPIPKGFLPKVRATKGFFYLYPSEDEALLGCTKVPLLRRLLFGFLVREGMRAEEAITLTWRAVDLKRGSVTLERHKTDAYSEPRTWALGADVHRALLLWRRHHRPQATLVFCDERGESVNATRLPRWLRDGLVLAGNERTEMVEGTERRQRLRVHDLRGTFVTLALANGKSEQWVADRTGHQSTIMIQRYRRAARTAAELALGWPAPLDTALPELAALGAKEGQTTP